MAHGEGPAQIRPQYNVHVIPFAPSKQERAIAAAAVERKEVCDL